MKTTTCFPEVLALVDDHYLSERRNVTRRFRRPVKHGSNPLMWSGQVPWEIDTLIFGSVRWDPFRRRYRMWYYVERPTEDVRLRPATALAESDDGIVWRRPNLDAIPWTVGGKKRKTNMVFESQPGERFIESNSVLIDPKAKAGRRYLMTYVRTDETPHGKYYRLAWSSDGIHWQADGNVKTPYHADRHAMIQAPETGEYLLFSRGEKSFGRKFNTCDPWRRTVTLQASRDLRRWSKNVVVLTADRKDPPYTNIYSMMPFFRGRMLGGVYQLHYQHAEEEIVTTHLCWSHDRTTWHKHREEFIPLGGPGEWDRYNNAVADQPVVIGDTMHFYYSGRTYRHGGYKPKGVRDTGPKTSGIGLATMKVDRFASLEASFDGGEFVTKPMHWPKGKRLFVNSQCRWGKIAIDLLSGTGTKPLATAELEGLDGVEIPVRLPRIQNLDLVRVRVRIVNARVYAMYWK
jgi:hypothetical protein